MLFELFFTFIKIGLFTFGGGLAMTNKYFQAFLGGIRPSIIGIILATGGWMIFSNILGIIGFGINV